MGYNKLKFMNSSRNMTSALLLAIRQKLDEILNVPDATNVVAEVKHFYGLFCDTMYMYILFFSKKGFINDFFLPIYLVILTCVINMQRSKGLRTLSFYYYIKLQWKSLSA